MKKVIEVKTTDRAISIVARINTGTESGFTTDEVNEIRDTLSDRLAEAIRGLPYVKYSLREIKIK